MLKEFAVEPAVFGDWQEFRCLYDKFGVPRARMIAEFPKSWRRRVYEASTDFTEIQHKKIEEWLSKKEEFLIPHNRISRLYNNEANWLQNAETSHTATPFHAIIANGNPRNHPNVIPSGTFYEDHALFQCPQECFMPRDTTGYLTVSRNLLQWATEVIFVDPYFTSFGQWMEPLRVMLNCISPRVQKVSYCTALNSQATPNERRQELETRLPPVIPSGQSLEIMILEHSPGQDTHNRYILTERGGLKFPWGLDARQDGSTDTVNLMGRETHLVKFEEYSEPHVSKITKNGQITSYKYLN